MTRVLTALALALSLKIALSMKIAPETPSGAPLATVNLATFEGAAAMQAQWRYSDVRIVDTDFLEAGPDGQPGASPNRAYDIAPHAGGADFDDSRWQAIAPDTLDTRRGSGRLSFAWYRVRLTIPERAGSFRTAGSTVVFDTSIDDYAEVWVNGELSRAPGQSGGSVIAGWNGSNRLVIARNVQPGQTIQLAIFGANGPLSNPPTNYIWMRHARVEFFEGDGGPVAVTPREVNVEVERIGDGIHAIVPRNAKLYKVAEGFAFTEGPVWVREGGYLLFSDPNRNTIYRYQPDGNLSVFRKPSGYAGSDIAEYGQPGSNGLTLDPQGRLTINEHGNHRVSRLDANGQLTVLADSYQGKRLNSPNDLVYRSDGTLFFTDPPFGLPRFFDDPRKELRYSGVFSLYRGKLQLLSTELKGPNGIALSPDEKHLYVSNWDEKRKVILRYDVHEDATVRNGQLFFDMTHVPDENALDGLKVDKAGNVYASAPGGLWILSPEGKHLGTIRTPSHAHNFAWGGTDGKTLYICARGALYRMPLLIEGVRP